MGFVWKESGTGGAECSWKVPSRRRAAGIINALVNAGNLQLECARVLHEALLVLVLIYGSDSMLWKEKERARVRAVQMDNLRGWIESRMHG